MPVFRGFFSAAAKFFVPVIYTPLGDVEKPGYILKALLSYIVQPNYRKLLFVQSAAARLPQSPAVYFVYGLILEAPRRVGYQIADS